MKNGNTMDKMLDSKNNEILGEADMADWASTYFQDVYNPKASTGVMDTKSFLRVIQLVVDE
jgi:hypothetical protein